MKTTAGQVAIELRKLADALDKEPDTVIPRPMVSFYCDDYTSEDKGKSWFLAMVRLLPRPLAKKTNNTSYEIQHGKDDQKSPIWLRAIIDRANVCTVIEPAKPAVYDCPSILSEAEEASLDEF